MGTLSEALNSAGITIPIEVQQVNFSVSSERYFQELMREYIVKREVGKLNSLVRQVVLQKHNKIHEVLNTLQGFAHGQHKAKGVAVTAIAALGTKKFERIVKSINLELK